jgi:hypothetical protein
LSKETGKTERNTGKIAASLVSHRMLNTVVALGSLLVGCLFFILGFEIPRDPILGMSVSNACMLGMADVGALSAAATFLTRILAVDLRFFIGFVAIQWVGAGALIRG